MASAARRQIIGGGVAALGSKCKVWKFTMVKIEGKQKSIKKNENLAKVGEIYKFGENLEDVYKCYGNKRNVQHA